MNDYYGTSDEFSYIDGIGKHRDKGIYAANNIHVRDLLLGYIYYMENLRTEWLNMDKQRCIDRARHKLITCG